MRHLCYGVLIAALLVFRAASPAKATLPLPDLLIGDCQVTEGNSGQVSASFTVSLTAALTSLCTVEWASANGTAAAGSDYVAGSGKLTFAIGETTKTILVKVNGDTAVEPNETCLVNL